MFHQSRGYIHKERHCVPCLRHDFDSLKDKLAKTRGTYWLYNKPYRISIVDVANMTQETLPHN